jgi:TolB-like protein
LWAIPGSVYLLEVEGISAKGESSLSLKQSANKSAVSKKWAFAVIGIILMLLFSYFYYTNQSKSQIGNKSQVEITDKSIAVLPFVNISNDPDQEALCDGLTEEIIHHLSRIKSFDKVISRSSVMSLKNSDKTLPEKAALLKVNIVLEGSFQQSGDQIKITAQLIDAVNDNHLWSEIYERPFGDIFEIQPAMLFEIRSFQGNQF